MLEWTLTIAALPLLVIFGAVDWIIRRFDE